MNAIHDPVLGDLTYHYGWVRDYGMRVFDAEVTVQLFIACAEDAEIEAAQRAAYEAFNGSKDALVEQAEPALFSYYTGIVGELREQFGAPLADEMAPLITRKEQLKSLLTPTQLFIQRAFGKPTRIVGLLFNCSWEPELGLAVKFVDEKIVDIGPQDIVL
jgi:hypothetical protein